MKFISEGKYAQNVYFHPGMLSCYVRHYISLNFFGCFTTQQVQQESSLASSSRNVSDAQTYFSRMFSDLLNITKKIQN